MSPTMQQNNNQEYRNIYGTCKHAEDTKLKTGRGKTKGRTRNPASFTCKCERCQDASRVYCTREWYSILHVAKKESVNKVEKIAPKASLIHLDGSIDLLDKCPAGKEPDGA